MPIILWILGGTVAVYTVFSVLGGGARVWPIRPYRGIISSFKASRPDADGNPATRFHAGVDVGAFVGDPVLAIADGVVLYPVSGYSLGGGLQAVAIRHSDADYIYAEIMVNANMKPGQSVRAGERIGVVARNGDGNSMLHMEAWERGKCPKGFTPWYVGKPPPPGLLNVQERLPAPPPKAVA